MKRGYKNIFSFFTGDVVISMIGSWKWQLYWKTTSQNLQSCVGDGKLDILYYGLPGLTSLLGMQLHGIYFMYTCSTIYIYDVILHQQTFKGPKKRHFTVILA
jgi:hypothetical protein